MVNADQVTRSAQITERTKGGDNGNFPGGVCIGRDNREIKFRSGAWVEITRYWYADCVTFSAIGHMPAVYSFVGGYPWGMMHSGRSPRIWHDPSPRSNNHFPGPCWKSIHRNEDGTTWVQIHREEWQALSFVEGRAKMGLA